MKTVGHCTALAAWSTSAAQQDEADIARILGMRVRNTSRLAHAGGRLIPAAAR